ncbi:TRAP transporter large permease subunit [Arthrobacter caoxuetaonis]|uniref:TRAP transporter large permease subunit n=1 Tax=Arthrobacter caoxuetaonis TaxID=2886935 RepID=UPI001D133477|nr:TRAP transporter large permease subunit [Arthrobacter caoxuetaonis]MCC3281977.1 TRAP transporter large permease subunit [Arthrobacter caoxuetaonis]MCC3282984.1 TRAP transporter large permease subunit [Arthrobacter caoxuetaonis]
MKQLTKEHSAPAGDPALPFPAGAPDLVTEHPPGNGNDGIKDVASAPILVRRFSEMVRMFSRLGGYVAGAMTLLLCLMIVVDVVARWLNVPLTGVLELSQYLFMPVLVFLSLAYAQSVGEHIRATILVDRLTVRGALIVNLGAQVVTLVTTIVLAAAATVSARHATAIDLQAVGAIDFPLWPIKIVVAAGLYMLALQVFSGLVSMIFALREALQGRHDSEDSSTGNRVLLWSSVAVMATLTALILFVPMSPLATGVVVILLTVILMLAGIPIGFAILIPSALGLWVLVGFNAVLVSFEDIPFNSTASWSLTVIPMFILMGTVMANFNLTAKVFHAAKQWMGQLPGGLAVSTNFAGAGLAAASGSSIAITYSLGRVAIPEMLMAGYKPRLATASVALSGTLGMLIPPSIIMVVYASTAGTPVGAQLMAGVIPGITLAVLFSLLILVWSSLDKSLAPRTDRSGVTWMSRLQAIPGILPMTVIIFAIIGGMFGGVFTPTEAGAVGAFLAVVLGWLTNRARRGVRGLATGVLESVREAVAGVAPIFLLLIGVHALTRVVALTGIADTVTEFVASMGLGREAFLLLLVPIIVVMGMFMDSMAMILLLVPVLTPTLLLLDADLVVFGIFLIILVEIGMVTPPIGILSYVVHRVARSTAPVHGKDVGLGDVFKGIVPFLVPALLLLVVIIFVPEFVLIGSGIE